MLSANRPSRYRPALRPQGFSLLEVMITAMLLGVLGVMGVGYMIDASKREQSLAVAVELASWLEGVQRQSTGVPGGCLVTLIAARNDPINNVNQGSLLAPGDTLARARPNADPLASLSGNPCSANATFHIPAAGFRTNSEPIFRIAANRPGFNSGQVTFSFTPRGGIDSTDRILVRIQRAPFESAAQTPSLRRGTYDTCVRIDRTTGMIGIGHGECKATEFDDQN